LGPHGAPDGIPLKHVPVSAGSGQAAGLRLGPKAGPARRRSVSRRVGTRLVAALENRARSRAPGPATRPPPTRSPITTPTASPATPVHCAPVTAAAAAGRSMPTATTGSRHLPLAGDTIELDMTRTDDNGSPFPPCTGASFTIGCRFDRRPALARGLTYRPWRKVK
jgi:hypothetical protein